MVFREGMGFSEEQVIEVLAEVFSSTDPRVILGIGDDAALVRGGDRQILTTDVAVEGVHFRSDWSTGFEIGRRIAAANIADVLSMNGRCDYLLVAATLTGEETLEWIRQLALGIQHEAERARAIVVGGDLARSKTLSIAITAVGSTTHPITRSGAQAGDSIYLSSLTGWSAAGLSMLESGEQFSEKAVARYKVPELDYDVDFSAATSMSDVSDAVLVQGRQMAKASGVAFLLDFALIQKADGFDELNALAEKMGIDVLDWILQGGEDHVLLATGKNLPGIMIGAVVEGSGISLVHNMKEIKMAPVSWSHFQKD
jgi:thiamine-monophosphate kinase